MRKYLIPEEGSFYKANLHAHSTVSDGGCTPQRLKEHYKNHGYSILAFTDHELLVDHSDLDDEDFLTITGVEYAFVEKEDYWSSKTIEFNMFAKNQHNVTQVCFDPSYVIHGEKWRADVAKRIGGDFKREYTIECMQKVIDTARENGFLVSLNHPCYSMETPEFFVKLDGLFAMEIYNTACDYECDMDKDAAYWDELLAQGIKIFGVASDDAHWQGTLGGGWVMVKAENNVNSILDSLKCGKFYSSCGPEILDFYIDGEKAYIDCSKAKRIRLHSANHPTLYIDADGDGMTHAEFNLKWWAGPYQYVRASVIDADGKKAWTNPIYLCEEGEE